MPSYTLYVYNLVGATGDPYSGNFTVTLAGTIVVSDSNGTRDDFFDDATHTGAADASDQSVTSSSVGTINVGDTVDPRFKNAFTGSDGSNGTVYSLATNGTNNYSTLKLVVSDQPLDAGVTYTFGAEDIDGAVSYSSLALCFAKGTRLETENGSIAVEDLEVGDRLRTLDNGLQPVRWIGVNKMTPQKLAAASKLRPIRISEGALGDGLPQRDLIVSPQHRLMVNSKIVPRMFEVDEILVPAVRLLDYAGVEQLDGTEGVDYYHILFDSHQIIFAEGAAAESLFLGAMTLAALSDAQKDEIAALFPEVSLPGFAAQPVRTIHKNGPRLKKLITRHAQNQRDLQTFDRQSASH